MIRSFHRLMLPLSDDDYRSLEDFFSALGFAPGESWNGRRSKGRKFEAFDSGVELAMGQDMPPAELVVEVDNADIVAEAARAKGFTFVSDIADCDWGARLFVLEIPAGFGRLAVFSYNENWRQPTKESQLDSTGMKFAIIVSRFNAFITERLLTGATDALRRTGAVAADIEIVRVPGAFELPATAKMLADTGNYQALVAIGCLLRGDTAHYDVIVNEVTRGIGEVTLATGVPIGFGVITCDTLEQAIDRAGLKMGNKGFEAALAALELAALRRTLQNK
ncbi:MAG TPA: 6,7-dimethyl-8-ribityllumazine synthase [Candidatus Saccharimonadales bacterium]|nr:6,7-dimethyl-8-ribityllumazine synthase [Candidatus Saccharimonadales bacterium]